MKRIGQKVYDSAAWKRLRRLKLESVNWLCERCGQPAQIVHHKMRITAGNVDDLNVTLNLDNLEALCQNCHNLEHDHFTAQDRAVFDSRGDVVAVTGNEDFAQARRAIQVLKFDTPRLDQA